MAVAAYRYYDDGGREFQVVLPTDFALALSYQSADPDAPYLPPSVSPRYVAFVEPNAALFRQAVVSNRAQLATLPQQVIADGYTWQLVGFYGERFMSLPQGNIQVMAGPQGAPGAPGTFSVQKSVPVADVAITASGTATLITQLANVAIGNYFTIARFQFQSAAAASRWDATIDTSGMGNSGSGGGTVYGATANQYYSLTVTAMISIINAANTIGMFAQSTVTTSSVRKNGAVWLEATSLIAFKL